MLSAVCVFCFAPSCNTLGRRYELFAEQSTHNWVLV